MASRGFIPKYSVAIFKGENEVVYSIGEKNVTLPIGSILEYFGVFWLCNHWSILATLPQKDRINPHKPSHQRVRPKKVPGESRHKAREVPAWVVETR